MILEGRVKNSNRPFWPLMQYPPLPLAAKCRERPFAPLPNYKTHPPFQYFRQHLIVYCLTIWTWDPSYRQEESLCIATQTRTCWKKRSWSSCYFCSALFCLFLMVAISFVTFRLQRCSANKTLPERASHILGWNLNRVHLAYWWILEWFSSLSQLMTSD